MRVSAETADGPRAGLPSRREMRIEREDLLRLSSSLSRVWLETDGVGGYAASTATLCATSRRHGLLVAPPRASARPHVFLSRFEETLSADGREFALSTARYAGVLHPEGHRFVASFEPTPFPSWRYAIGDVEIRRDVLLVHGEHTALVRWRLLGGRTTWTLSLRPFLPCREADALTFDNVYLVRTVRNVPGGIAATPYASLPAVTITTSRPAPFVADAHWYRGVEFSDDLARGEGGHEDQFTPGRFDVELSPGDEFVVAATIAKRVADPAARLRSESRRRRGATPGASGVRAALDRAADQFVARTADGRPGVIAGFPAAASSARTACIALPGLLLARGRVEECGEALAVLSASLRDGRDADAGLWLARAVRHWEKAGGDGTRLLSEFLPTLAEIARGCRARADAGGLLASPAGGTWMDAAQGGVPVTPREGCAVEVNALWFALLDHLTRLARRAGRPREAREWTAMRRTAGESFLARFWLEDEGRLADVWKDGAADRRIRPNMVIAAALEFSPLSRGRRAAIVERSRAELLTPRGLRSLSPRDPDYRGRCDGDARARDAARHQGAAWPWLLGFHVEAHVRAHGRGAASRRHARELVRAFEPHLDEGAMGQVAELFDGDPPHRPGGAWADAASVAELLRAWTLVG
jgi:predicted glycogen debranching enzyme